MPRPLRVHVPGGFYHVTSRGNHREALFATRFDRDYLGLLIDQSLLRYGAVVHAFCWMTNHLHLFIQICEDPLGKIMQKILARYALYRHKLMQTGGHLFEQHHGARLVNADAYFKQLVRYIHLNPVAAGIVSNPVDYEWSSHRAYLGLEKIAWLQTDYGLSQFGRELGRARKAFNEFVCQPNLDTLDLPALYQDTTPLDPAAYRVKVPPYRRVEKSHQSLEQLTHQLCRQHSISPLLLRSASKQRYLTPIRVEFARTAIHSGIANGAEVARFLGRHPSAVAHWLSRYPQQPRPEIPLS